MAHQSLDEDPSEETRTTDSQDPTRATTEDTTVSDDEHSSNPTYTTTNKTTTVGTIYNTNALNRTKLEKTILDRMNLLDESSEPPALDDESDSDDESSSAEDYNSSQEDTSDSNSDESQTPVDSTFSDSDHTPVYNSSDVPQPRWQGNKRIKHPKDIYRKPKHQRQSYPYPKKSRTVVYITNNCNIIPDPFYTDPEPCPTYDPYKDRSFEVDPEKEKQDLHEAVKREYRQELEYWSKHIKNPTSLTERRTLRDSLFELEYNPEYGDTYPSQNIYNKPTIVHPLCPNSHVHEALRIWSLKLLDHAELQTDEELEHTHIPETSTPQNPRNPLPPPEPPPDNSDNESHESHTNTNNPEYNDPNNNTNPDNIPQENTTFIIKEGTIYDMRGKTMEELVEVIMACRDDDGHSPINIQIDTDQQVELEEYICAPDILRKLQTKEQATQDSIEALLDEPCLAKLKLTCTNSSHELRPKLFPEELWQYVEDTQKPLVKARMAPYDQELLEMELAGLRQNLKINPNRPHCRLYYEAQALANLDRYIVVDENNPPMVGDNFTFPIDLKEGAVVEKCKPQTFTEIQKKFLDAKTHLLQMTDKIELRSIKLNPEDWNSRLMLVEYKDRVAASRAKWSLPGMDFLQEASRLLTMQKSRPGSDSH